jgi:hypothetical protein
VLKSERRRAYLAQMKIKVEMHLKKAEDTQQELGVSSASSATNGDEKSSSPAGAPAVR